MGRVEAYVGSAAFLLIAPGTVAGIAGSLYAQFQGSVSPDAFFWTTSGEALLMVIIGGTGTLGGAFLGAATFILLQSLVSSYTERWMLILGLTFVLLVLFVVHCFSPMYVRTRTLTPSVSMVTWPSTSVR